MSILIKPYEISVYDDVLVDGVLVEKRLGIIGSDLMEGLGRALEPNLIRNVNGENKFSFKMYRKYIDTITGEEVENPFINWLVSERKIKLKYGTHIDSSGNEVDTWYDFIIKDISENSSNYLYTYSLSDALVQELSKNGYGVTLDAALMNNVGDSATLAREALKETDWSAEAEVVVQTVEESLVYAQLPNDLSNLNIYHLADQGEDLTKGVVPTLLEDKSRFIVKNNEGKQIGTKPILAFYSSCKNKPHRFQFIFNEDGYAINEDGSYQTPRNEDRIITLDDCQYYIEFNTPEEDYSVHKPDYDIYLPTGFDLLVSLPQDKSKDTDVFDTQISTWYRGARYGYSQQAEWVPLLERYCQKFHKEETIQPTEKLHLEGGNENSITKSGNVYTKTTPYSGIYFEYDYDALDAYKISYTLTVTGKDDQLKRLGGHKWSFDTRYSATIDGQTLSTNEDYITFDSALKQGQSVDVEAYYTKKIPDQTDQVPYIFIQPNRGLADKISFEISNLEIKAIGDYYGYTESKFVSPTIVKNCINNYRFETKSGWNATSNKADPVDQRPEVESAYGRFENGKFRKITEDFLDGKYSDTLTYAPYLEMSFYNSDQFILNSGLRDNRTIIGNMPKDDRWILDYEILNESEQDVSDNFSVSIGEYLYNTTSGGYVERTGLIAINEAEETFTNENSGKNRKIFEVKTTTYTEGTFKEDSKLYLKLQPNSECRLDENGPTKFYLKKISLYKKSIGSDGRIIEPDYEEKQSKAASEWVNQGAIEHTYNYFNVWHVNPDNLDACVDKKYLPLSVRTKLDYNDYKPVYNEGAEKIRTVTAKESNYFNILQSIAETFEQWMFLEIERNEDGSIKPEGKKIKFKNYRGSDNYACFRYGVNLKDITRTYASKDIVTKLIVKQNANEHAEDGFCTIQRAGSNPTGENYLYDFQYYQKTGIMNVDEYLQTNYYINGAEGPDKELWENSNGWVSDTDYNLNGYFLRLKKINDTILPVNKELIGLQGDLVQRKAELQTETAKLDAAASGLETTREDFRALTGIYPEQAQAGKILGIATQEVEGEDKPIVGIIPNEDWYNTSVAVDGTKVTVTVTSKAIDTELFPTIKHTQGVKQIDTTSKYAYKLTKSTPYDGSYVEYDCETGEKYNLTYTLDVNSGTLYNIGGHNTSFNGEGYSIVVTDKYGVAIDRKTINEDGSNIPSNIYAFNSPVTTGTYKVTVTGVKNDSSKEKSRPYLYIQPNRLLNDEITYTISNVRFFKKGNEEETADKITDSPRKASMYLTTMVEVKNDDTEETTNIEKTYGIVCTIEAGQSFATVEQVVTAVDKESPDVQKYIEEYSLFFEKEKEAKVRKVDLEKIVEEKEKDIQTLEARRKILLEYKRVLNQLFFSRYSRFIQEGTWISEEHTDDEKYYNDAQSVLYNSCYPQVTYNINVLELSRLPGYEMFSFEVGDKTWAIDEDFFGNSIGEEVIITEFSERLDDPNKNNIKVQNFKNQFQDLFQKITATVQQAQYNNGKYERNSALLDANSAKKNEFITNAINDAASFLAPGRSHTVTWEGGQGITVTDDQAPLNQVRIVGGAILLSKEHPDTKEQTWMTGVTNKGISADLITAGKIDTGEIQIMYGKEPVFRWDAHGISAYDALWNKSGDISTISGVNSKKFVRFDKHGIYGIKDNGIDGSSWYPTGLDYDGDAFKEIDDKATFALTWEGLKVTGSTGGTARLGKQNGYIMFVQKPDGTGTFGITEDGKIQTTGIEITSGTIGGQNLASTNYADGVASTAKTEAIAEAQGLVNGLGSTLGGNIEEIRDNLQSQIDGNISTYFLPYLPTASRYPVIDGTSSDGPGNGEAGWEGKYVEHNGDLFYVTSPNGEVFTQTNEPTKQLGIYWIHPNSNQEIIIQKCVVTSEDDSTLKWETLTADSDEAKIVEKVGYCYRWQYTDTTNTTAPINSNWVLITDTAIAEALADAAKAQSTADGKATIFSEKPQTAYQYGDLIIPVTTFKDGTGDNKKTYSVGKIYRCKDEGEHASFNNSHWEEVNYTDNAELEAFVDRWDQEKTTLEESIGGCIKTSDLTVTSSTDEETKVTTSTITFNGVTTTSMTSPNGKYLLTNVGVGTKTADGSNKYFEVATDGALIAQNAVIYGNIFANGGYIAGWDITRTATEKSIKTGDLGKAGSFLMYAVGGADGRDGTEEKPYLFGSMSSQTWRMAIGTNFGVNERGELYCTSGNFSGSINATSGNIAGWNISGSSLTKTGNSNIGILSTPERQESQGLDLSDDGKVLYGIGSCTDNILIIPEGIENIGARAFSRFDSNNQERLNAGWDRITKVVMPKTLKTIQVYAFAYCEKLQEVILNDGLTIIDQNAFMNCPKLTKLYMPLGASFPSQTFYRGSAYEETPIDVYFEADTDPNPKDDWKSGSNRTITGYYGIKRNQLPSLVTLGTTSPVIFYTGADSQIISEIHEPVFSVLEDGSLYARAMQAETGKFGDWTLVDGVLKSGDSTKQDGDVIIDSIDKKIYSYGAGTASGKGGLVIDFKNLSFAVYAPYSGGQQASIRFSSNGVRVAYGETEKPFQCTIQEFYLMMTKLKASLET